MKILISGHSGLSWTMQAVRSCTRFWLSWAKGISRSQIWRERSSVQPFYFLSLPHTPGLPFPGAPHGTYSGASSTKRYLRTLGSSNCAGSARWAHQENDSGWSNSESCGPHPEHLLSPLLNFIWWAFQNVPIQCPIPHYWLRSDHMATVTPY